MSTNPLLRPGRALNLSDIRNALSDIKTDIEKCQEEQDQLDRSWSEQKEMMLVMDLSGLEIKMTNFADALRKKFV